MTKKELWQIRHEESGYEVECLFAGQVRRYGPSVQRYLVRDMTGERGEREILDYCLSEVSRADEKKTHSVIKHLQKFEKQADGRYLYVVGRDYTG